MKRPHFSVQVPAVLFSFAVVAMTTGCPGGQPDACEYDGIEAAAAPFDGTSNYPYFQDQITKLIVSDDGRLAIPYEPSFANYSFRIWDGSGWKDQLAYPTFTSTLLGTQGGPVFSQYDGRFMAAQRLVDVNDGQVHFSIENADGTPGALETFDPTHGIMTTAISTTDSAGKVVMAGFSGTGGHEGDYLMERSANGSWVSNLMRDHLTSVAIIGQPLGVGYAPDGTPWVVARKGTSDMELQILRRSGANWQVMQTVASFKPMYNVRIVVSPSGAANPRVLVAWSYAESNLGAIYAFTYDLTNYTKSDLLTVKSGIPTGLSWGIFPAFAFNKEGTGGAYSYSLNQDKTAWLGHFTGTTFSAPGEYRPDLANLSPPIPFYDSCGNLYAGEMSGPAGGTATLKIVKVESAPSNAEGI